MISPDGASVEFVDANVATVLATLLSKYSQCSDLVIGVIMNGRATEKLKALPGMCANVIGVRNRVSGGLSVGVDRDTRQNLLQFAGFAHHPSDHSKGLR